jgi:hypothetical protein
MASLANEFGFSVAVIIAPGASRLHGPYYRDFPEISAAPHVIEFITESARSVGFETVDLYQLLEPYAGTELLYFRDDDHFNHRGNALAAELIHLELFANHSGKAM